MWETNWWSWNHTRQYTNILYIYILSLYIFNYVILHQGEWWTTVALYVFACSVMFLRSMAPDHCRNFLILELGMHKKYHFEIWNPWILKLRTLSEDTDGKYHMHLHCCIHKANNDSPHVYFLSVQWPSFLSSLLARTCTTVGVLYMNWCGLHWNISPLQ